MLSSSLLKPINDCNRVYAVTWIPAERGPPWHWFLNLDQRHITAFEFRYKICQSLSREPQPSTLQYELEGSKGFKTRASGATRNSNPSRQYDEQFVDLPRPVSRQNKGPLGQRHKLGFSVRLSGMHPRLRAVQRHGPAMTNSRRNTIGIKLCFPPWWIALGFVRAWVCKGRGGI